MTPVTKPRLSYTFSYIIIHVYLHSVTDRIEPVGNDIRAAEAGVDVPGATFIVEQPVETEVRLRSHGEARNAKSNTNAATLTHVV